MSKIIPRLMSKDDWVVASSNSDFSHLKVQNPQTENQMEADGIRPAQSTDLSGIHELFLSLPSVSPYILKSVQDEQPTLDQRRGWLDTVLSREQDLLLVARHSDGVVGLFYFERGRSQKTRHKGSIAIAVKESHRGCGVGAKLIEHFERWLESQKNLIKVDAHVMEKNSACLHLLERHGFRAVARIPDAYILDNGQLCDEIVLVRSVREREVP